MKVRIYEHPADRDVTFTYLEKLLEIDTKNLELEYVTNLIDSNIQEGRIVLLAAGDKDLSDLSLAKVVTPRKVEEKPFCESIKDLTYVYKTFQMKGSLLFTWCQDLPDIKVGSNGCQDCKHFKGRKEKEYTTIKCSYDFDKEYPNGKS